MTARRLRRLALIPVLGAALFAGALAWSPAAGAVTIAGVDPAKEPIPGASFACYQEVKGDSYSAPAFTLGIQAGRRYTTPSGGGSFTVDPSEILSITWTDGPLAGNFIESSARFDDWGQVLSVRTGDDLEYECYQSGAAHQVGLIGYRLKDPAVATYPCVVRDTGATGPTFEILPGRTYRLDGVTGSYSADVTGDASEDYSAVEFSSGPLTGENAFYEQDGDTGLREMSIFTTPRLECRSLGKPVPKPRFGAGKAPKVAKGGLSGLYASFQVDVTGICGGLCWDYVLFTPQGRVYTREPETGLKDAACTRLLPNGLPVCEAYRRTGSTITIGDDPPASFRTTGKGVRIGTRDYRRVAPTTRLKLRGKYRSFSFIAAGGGTGGTAVERVFTFRTNGTFTRSGFVGASFFPAPGDPGGSVVATGGSTNTGRYRVVGPNSMEFRFADGTRRRAFFFLPNGATKSTRPGSIRLAGNDYVAK